MKQKYLSRYQDIEPFITKDGSVIRELMHPGRHAAKQQSLAEARVAVGAKTVLHRHHHTEELYYVTAGRGLMTLGDQRFEVKVGDSICIAPGTPHCIENTGSEELALLCCCSPGYSHEDTELLASQLA
ncbi:hypothetical protein Tel_06735 [Candidatus Tenderia electrophaga]|jgi:mannose-6-phosphate isomerase-like protein (cupin superfamily)|uniref:Cupin type-2 domain-containing protein n=1 Tax=Candidatus Tenderia electrophaga TaxID=1748243 RepID=A0A0S2TCJ6_9GAMM|nr:hypothetical protein Tel_06735 [Candidatus Tenderia electrophaga]